MGRKQNFSDEALLLVRASGKTPRLQSASTRRAIINRMIETGGRSTVADLDAHFGFGTRLHVLSLLAAGWIEVAK